VLGGLPPHSAQRPRVPHRDCRRILLPPSQSGTPAPPIREKRGNLHHNKNPAMGNIASISLSEKNCWSSRRKKTQNPNFRGTRDKIPNQKQLQMSKSQCRVKQKDNCSPSKANSTTKDIKTCIEEEISNNEYQKTIANMINDLKEKRQKLVFGFKEDMNKQINELKENTNR
jgi:hypothetical protein